MITLLTNERPTRARFQTAAMLAMLLALGVPMAFAAKLTTAAAAAEQRDAVAKGLYQLAYSAKQDAVYVASSGGFGDGAGPDQELQLDPKSLDVKATI